MAVPHPLAPLYKRRRKKQRQAERKKRKEEREKRNAQARPPVPFVVGVNRSGTTLLRMMLDAHPQLAIPPETHFIPALKTAVQTAGKEGEPMNAADVVEFLTSHRRWDDFGLDPDELCARLDTGKRISTKKVLRAFYRLYAESQGKERFGDKTPGYVKQMGAIQRALPEARFVHLIRDGRDVALSREDRAQVEEHSVERLAIIWKRRISRARRQRNRIKHYKEFRYEDLVARPEETLRAVCEFIDLPYDPAMLDYHQRAGERLQEIARDLPDEEGGTYRTAEERLEAHSLVTDAPRLDRVGAWRETMSPEDVAIFENIAGDLLAELGYEVSARSPGS